MKVKFNNNPEPCIQYEVLDQTEIMEYDDVVFNAYVPHIKISVLGLIPKQLLIETNNQRNIDAIDVAVCLQNY